MSIKPIKIKNVTVPGNVFLAPLAGVTDVGFRHVCRLSGAFLSYTEMVSAKGLYYKNPNTNLLLATEESESPSAVQIFGSEPDIMALACQNPLLQKFDIIDINMGCPVPKVVKCGEGSALMKTPKLAEKIIKACVKATDKPVTVKFRKGYDGENAAEFAKMCEGAGASLITVHGRLRSEFYGGKNDSQTVKRVKDSVSIPVFHSGDIFTADGALSAMQQTGADGVMIARGSMGNPQIFSQLAGIAPLTDSRAIMLHAETLAKHSDEGYAVRNIRKHLLWYLDKIPGGKAFKLRAGKAAAFKDLKSLVSEVFQ